MAGPNIQSPGPATPMFDIIRDEEGKVQELRLTPEWSAFFSLLAQVQFSATRSGSTSARPSSEMLRWIGMQTYDTDEQSPAWLKQASTNTWIYPQIIGNDLILPNEKTYGIKLDVDTPDYGYRDILGAIDTRGLGPTDPAFNIYSGTIRQYQFAVNDVAFVNFHMPHDYVPGSDIFLHYHWSHISGSVTGGTVTWGYEITFSKGFDQEAFVTPVSGTVVGTQTSTRCPICEEADLKLVTYVFGPRLSAQGRCVSTAKEMRQLNDRSEELSAYVVEACVECRWNHVLRVIPVGGRT